MIPFAPVDRHLYFGLWSTSYNSGPKLQPSAVISLSLLLSFSPTWDTQA